MDSFDADPEPPGQDAAPAPLQSDMADADLDQSRSTAFEVRSRRRKAKRQTPGSHELSFTVTCALALNTAAAAAAAPLGGGPGDSSGQMGDAASVVDSTAGGPRGGRAGAEAPRALGYFHLEQQLFPDDPEPMRTDLVHFGVAAKVYPERADPRTIKTWASGDEAWIAWSQSAKANVTTDFLRSLCDHRLRLRLWDSKDKCSSRCRWDTKPKAFRFPPPKPGQDPENVGGVKACVLRLSRTLDKQLASRMYVDRPLPHEYATTSILKTAPAPAPAPAPARRETKDEAKDEAKAKEPNYAVYAVTRADRAPNVKSYSRLERLAMTDVEPERKRAGGSRASRRTPQSKSGTPAPDAPPGSAAQQGGGGMAGPAPADGPVDPTAPRTRTRRSKKKVDEEQRRYDQEGRCSIELPMAGLFIGQTVIARLKSPVAAIEDFMICITINGPLLSETQRRDLNPLIVRVRGADSMPERPLGFSQLRDACDEAYCRYRFFDQPFHQTAGRPQDAKVVWDDVKVVLTGLFDKGALHEYLGGPAMEIEVHDRDRKDVEEKLEPALFGDDLEDEKISNIGTVTAKRTAHSAFGKKLKPWDPYGVSRVDLSSLLDGHKLVHFSLPILPCSIPDQIKGEVDSSGRVLGTAGAVDAPQETPLPAGHYLESGATLKVSLELLYPLSVKRSELDSCPYGRLVFDVSFAKMPFVRKVIRFVKQTNAHAFGLAELPQHVISNALLNYRLTAEQKADVGLNFLTGFHLMDGVRHLIVIEGLRGDAIKALWQSLGSEVAADSSEDRVLYNESLAFSARLYTDLDLDVMKVKLNEPLADLVQQPLLYVRDMVPRLCFDGLRKLFELSQVRTMQNAVRSDLFPGADMFRAVGREFGVPLTVVDLQRLENASPDLATAIVHEQQQSGKTVERPQQKWTPLDNFNEKHLRMLAERRERPSTHNFVQENKKRVREESAVVHQARVSSCPAVRVAAEEAAPAAHNYSIQNLNSTEIAKQKVRSACRPDKLYTYSPDFHNSGSLERDFLQDRLRREEVESRRKWRSQKGWVYPGKKRSLDANQHPRKLDNARMEALKDRWEENANHRAILQPTVPGRESFTWKERKRDLNVWSRPGRDATFGQEPPSIMAPGVHQENELNQAAEQETERWLARLIVSDTRFHSHRLLPSTENCEQGPRASNDLDKLQGLLKDKPVKYGFLFPGYRDVAPLSVVRDAKGERGAYTPGDAMHVSLQRGFLPKERDSAPVMTPCAREPLYHRRIDPLAVDERENHLFPENGTVLHPRDRVRFAAEAERA